MVGLSTPCNGFFIYYWGDKTFRLRFIFQLHVMDSRPPHVARAGWQVYYAFNSM